HAARPHRVAEAHSDRARPLVPARRAARATSPQACPCLSATGQITAITPERNPKLPSRDPSMRIALLARNPALYSHRRICEAARGRGHDIEVIKTLRVSINITSRKPTLYYRKRRLDGFDAVIPRIGASVTFYGRAVLRQSARMSS